MSFVETRGTVILKHHGLKVCGTYVFRLYVDKTRMYDTAACTIRRVLNHCAHRYRHRDATQLLLMPCINGGYFLDDPRIKYSKSEHNKKYNIACKRHNNMKAVDNFKSYIATTILLRKVIRKCYWLFDVGRFTSLN